jgi:hypothetical protein
MNKSGGGRAVEAASVSGRMVMSDKLYSALVMTLHLGSIGGLIYSVALLRKGQKRKGYRVVLISVLALLSFAAYLSISE